MVYLDAVVRLVLRALLRPATSHNNTCENCGNYESAVHTPVYNWGTPVAAAVGCRYSSRRPAELRFCRTFACSMARLFDPLPYRQLALSALGNARNVMLVGERESWPALTGCAFRFGSESPLPSFSSLPLRATVLLSSSADVSV